MKRQDHMCDVVQLPTEADELLWGLDGDADTQPVVHFGTPSKE